MGIIERLLRPTPFYNSYKNYLKKKNELAQEKLEKQLHPLRIAFYQQFLQPGQLVFDVGANVGNRVSSFLACGAKVVAVEPQPSCVQILQQKFGHNITIEHIGLGQQHGELEMQIATDSTVSSFNNDYINKTKDRFKYTEWVDKIKVKILKLDDLISKYGTPQFCKIDVEGYELEVLKGLHGKLPFISLEYCVPEMQSQLMDCVARLHQLDDNGQFNYSVGESMTWALPGWMDFDGFKTHLQSKEFINTSFGDIYFRDSEKPN